MAGWFKITGLIVLILLIFVAWLQAPRLNSATGLAARQLCSLHYASHIDAEFVRGKWIDPHISPASNFVSLIKDASTRSTEASIFGLFKAKARYRGDGHGCVLDFGEQILELKARPVLAKRATPPETALEDTGVYLTTHSNAFDAEKLQQALVHAFKEPTEDENRQTAAIAVLYKGELVAEKVRDGLTIDTPLPGYSMAKSMTATLVGLLVRNEGLDVYSVVPDAAELTDAGVTYDHLLRMVSGINVLEDGSGLDPNSIMLTQKNDAAAYAIEQGLKAAPGEEYDYTGGGPIVLAKKFNSIVAPNNASDAYAYIQEHLIEPLDLTTVILESDGTGTFLGSTYMSASAYDWAKLGQLYLQDGVWNGARILPEGWFDYVCTVTPQSGKWVYGAGFWTGKNGGKDAQWAEESLHLPEDACFMHGMMNQAVYIIPSKDLVIVKLSSTRSYRESGELELVRDVIGAMLE